MEPFGGGVWPQHLDTIEQALDEVERTRRGALLLYHGDPELGRTRLLADALVRLGRRSPRPGLLAGGFDVAGARGDFTAGALPFMSVGVQAALRALGLAGAGAAVPAPAQMAGAVATLLGEVGDAPEPARRFQDPEELLRELETRLEQDSRLVLCLADVDRAAPPLLWWELFLLRLLPPLLSRQPLLVLATAASQGALAGTDELAELAELGLARAVELEPYTPRDLAAELGDSELAEEVAALTGGDPERVVTQFAGWRRDGAVEEHAGAWHPTAPLDGAGVQARRLLVLTLGSPDPAPYDRAVRALRTAALEGMTFTVQPLAAVLEEDPDELSDFLDDHLVADDAHPFAPLEAAGFVAGTSLYRYRFRSRLLWTVFHPVHGRREWQEPMGHRRLAGRYTEALAAAYGPFSQEAVFPLWHLRREAGNADDYAAMANATAAPETVARVLAADADADDAELSPRALTATVRRFVANGRQILGSDVFMHAARRAQERLPALTGADSLLLARETLMLLSAGAAAQDWHGDEARAAASVLDGLREHEVAGRARVLTDVTNGLLRLVRAADSEAGWARAAQAHLDVAVPWLDELLLAPGDLAARRERVLARARDLLGEARRLVPSLPPDDRQHREAHILDSAGVAEALAGELERARDTLRSAIALLEDRWWSCAIDQLAYGDLAAVLEQLAEYDEASAAWRRTVALAMGHGDPGSAAAGLARWAIVELRRDEPGSAASLASHAVVLGATDAWDTLVRVIPDARRPAGKDELAHLRALTGIGQAETEAFLAAL